MENHKDVSNCNRCMHWEENVDDWPKWRKTFGQCKASPHSEDAVEWDDDDGEHVLLPHHAEGTAFVMDASGYFATLITAPNHGRTMFYKG